MVEQQNKSSALLNIALYSKVQTQSLLPHCRGKMGGRIKRLARWNQHVYNVYLKFKKA